MARLSPCVPFGLVLAFQTWLWPFWPAFGLSDTLFNLTFCEIDVICVQSSTCQHGLQESLQKLSDFIVRGEVPCQISQPSRGCSSVRPHTVKTVFTRGETATYS